MFRRDDKRDSHYLQWTAHDTCSPVLYTRGRVLGKGGFGKCYELVDPRDNARYACKVIDKAALPGLMRQKLMEEIAIHRRLKHGNIVGFEGCMEDDHFIYILLEICPNNSLCELLQRRKNLEEVEVRYFVRQLLEAMVYMHGEGVVHRDLKLQNCFISEQMGLRLGDFGLAGTLKKGRKRKSQCGTAHYMAPDMNNSEGYGQEVDIWSLGVMTFLMLCGRFPFECKDSKTLQFQSKNGNYLRKTVLSECARSLIRKMLQFDPVDRPSARQLLQDEFFAEYQVPQKLPLSCMACAPLNSFLDQYRYRRKAMHDSEDFQFLLESKDSPDAVKEPQSPKVTRKKEEVEHYTASAKKIVSETKDDRVWVQEWWEFPKYGLVYKMTDGSVGVRFNDASSLKACKMPQEWVYRQKGKATHIDSLSCMCKTTNAKLKMASRLIDQIQPKLQVSECYGQGTYVRLYYNCLELFMIWLSNGSIQAHFDDGTTVILNSHYQLVIKSDCISQFTQENIQKEADLTKKFQEMTKVIRRIRTAGQSGKENLQC